ncbi:hypothetical protein WJX72_006499 [[Myrmecia] bisecta]|uniref:Uncharacterized protein n=1 Tax=[Myrmecia] bisecta TaxID=41462 RepID=A0AAW1QR25_9CHLO
MRASCTAGAPPAATETAAVSQDRAAEAPSASASSSDVDFQNGSPLAAPDRGDDWSPPEAADEATHEFAVAMAKVASDTKGEDILVLHVGPLVYWTSYMMFVTVFSKPQLNAIIGKIEKEAAENWGRVITGANPGRGEWEVLDFGDVVIHAFTSEQRDYYDLESFYGAAEEVELKFLAEERQTQSLGWQKSL